MSSLNRYSRGRLHSRAYQSPTTVTLQAPQDPPLSDASPSNGLPLLMLLRAPQKLPVQLPLLADDILRCVHACVPFNAR